MLYAMTGVRAISALPGCPGHTYDQRADKSDPHMSISCAVHEAHLAKDPLWSSSPAHVPLSELEKKEAEEAEANRDRLATKNSADSAAVLAQTAALLAEISAKLNAAPPPGAPAAPVPVAPAATAPAAVTQEPASPAARPKGRKPRATAGAPA